MRLAPVLFRNAKKVSRHVAKLLPVCRTIDSAKAELRWIRQHVKENPHEAAFVNNSRIDAPWPPKNRRRGESWLARKARLGKIKIKIKIKTQASGIAKEEDRVSRLVARRSTGRPLQYVLGTQPFGDLEILCGRGVLIPRPETEAWTALLANLVLGPRPRPRPHHAHMGDDDGEVCILDLCSGTGCIALSLYARGVALRRNINAGKGGRFRVFGFDVEPRAPRLGRRNVRRNFRGDRLLAMGISDVRVEETVTFARADIFEDEWMRMLEYHGAPGTEKDHRPPSPPPPPRPLWPSTSKQRWKWRQQWQEWQQQQQPSGSGHQRRIDLMVANPPYVSQRGFDTATERSVRNYEPKLALVPDLDLAASIAAPSCLSEDIFYQRLLAIAESLQPPFAAFEVGDMAQAVRVLEMAAKGRRGEEQRWHILEIWRDVPDAMPAADEETVVMVSGRQVPVRGSGHGRVVFLSQTTLPRSRFMNAGFRRDVYTG
ncbi:S-adenosyl-L-methionine-dependent methyltransferase [Xylaria cf. heliscus]|nr:S-adenosyl-L-methionine-dependent methyltransferase [Xylaria cf. heliscus]